MRTITYIRLLPVIMILLALAAFLSLTGGAAIAAPPAGPQKILSFMNTMNDEENETLFELMKEFSVKRPDVKINVENISFYDAKSALEKRFADGDLPDVMRVEIRLVLPFAKKGMFHPLDEYAATADYVDYLPYLYKFCVDGKSLFAIPQVTDCLVLLYNRAHFADAKIVDAPKTMEQFLKFAQKLTVDEEGNVSDSPAFNQYKTARHGFSYHFESYYLLPIIFSYGANLCDDSGRPLVKSEKTQAAIRFIYDLKNRYNVVPAKIDPKFGHDFTLMEFMDGRVSMIIDGPWNIRKVLKGAAFSGKADNLGVAPIPRKEVSGSPIGGQFLAVSSKCRYPREAYEFINFINSREAQVRFAKKNYLIPTRKSAMEDMQKDTAGTDSLIRKSLFDQMKQAALYAFSIPEPAYLDEMNRTVEKLLNGSTGFEEGLSKLEESYKKLSAARN